MASFLFTLWPFPGHIHPNVAVAHALRERGHEVVFYTAGSLVPFLEGEGFRCCPFRELDGERAEERVLALDALSLRPWRASEKKALLRDWLLGTVEDQLRDLEAIAAEVSPDVLVCDPSMWGPLLVFGERSGIPLAVLSCLAVCMLPGPEGPIVGLPLPRARGRIARLGQDFLRWIAGLVAADVRREAEELRARHGLAPMGVSVTEFSARVPLYLVPSTPAYDRQRRDLPPTVHYVGPCQWDKPGASAPPAWLSQLPRERPIVYVTEGTMHAKPALLLPAALEGLASLPVQVIATTGKHRDPEALGLGPLPANARVEQWIPHSDLFPRTDVVVTNGGTGTVLASLAAGIPLLVVPMAWDQHDNAWRISEAGAGIRLPAKRCNPESVREAVGRLLTEESFRRNARRLAADFARYGGASLAAELLADLAQTRAAVSRNGTAAPNDESPSRVASSTDVGGF